MCFKAFYILNNVVYSGAGLYLFVISMTTYHYVTYIAWLFFSVPGVEHLTQITCQCWRLCPAVLMARTALHWSAALAPQTRTNKRQQGDIFYMPVFILHVKELLLHF